jgi:hypothetical protein
MPTLLGPLESDRGYLFLRDPNSVGISPHLRTETDPVSETSCFPSNYLESGWWTKSENLVILCLLLCKGWLNKKLCQNIQDLRLSKQWLQTVLYCRIYHHIARWNSTDISEELVTEAPPAACFILVSCLPYSSTLKMEATCSSKTSLDFQQATWCYIPEYRTLLPE